MDEEDNPLSVDDVKFIVESKAGQHLIEELKVKLARTRMEVDEVSGDGLPRLQGRIATLKELILILGVEYE